MHWAIIVSLARYERNNHAVHAAHNVQAFQRTSVGRNSDVDTG